MNPTARRPCHQNAGVNGNAVDKEGCHRLIDRLASSGDFYGEVRIRYKASGIYQVVVTHVLEHDAIENYLNH